MVKVVARFQNGFLNHRWDIWTVPAIFSIALALFLINNYVKFQNLGSGIPVSEFQKLFPIKNN